MSIFDLWEPELVGSLTKSLSPAYAKLLLARKSGLQEGQGLPLLEARAEAQAADQDRLKAFQDLLSIRRTDVLPPTYPQVMALPLMIEIFGDERFPLPAMGLIHVRNEIRIARKIGAFEAMALTARAEGGQMTERGFEFDVAIEGAIGDETVWSALATFLYRRKGREGAPKEGPRLSPFPAEGSHYQLWSVSADLGRRYGAVSGDLNPIHLFGWTARLFGFKAPIAHGMWSLARSLAAIEAKASNFPLEIACSFKKPLLLPGKVQMRWREEKDEIPFALLSEDGSVPYLLGSLRSRQDA